MALQPAEKQRLEAIAQKLRYDVIEMIGTGMAGHIGGSCSAADVVAAIYFYKMKYDSPDFVWEKRDKFVMSKGHAVPVQYAALVYAGLLDRELYKTFKNPDSPLQGHPDKSKCSVLEANTGSLGQGLSLGVGFAFAAKIDESPSRTYVIIGDGESAEGQIWEAAMSADVYKLDNLTAVLDMNGLLATGTIKERFNVTNMKEKFEAFGWHTIEIDGHNMEEICAALDEACATKGKPTILLAKTVKGKGIPFAENNPGYHNAALNKEQYEEALRCLSAGEKGEAK